MAGVLLLELAAALCPSCGKSVRMASITMMRCASANCTRCGASGCAVPALSTRATTDLARTDEPSKARSSSCTAAITTITLYDRVHCIKTVHSCKCNPERTKTNIYRHGSRTLLCRRKDASQYQSMQLYHNSGCVQSQGLFLFLI